MSAEPSRKSLAVWKFSSCDGCQLSLLDCEDELLAIAEELDIAYFLEATSASVEGPYDVSLVEGSITTPHELERIREVRASSRALITIGACATSGGIQALRNFADVEEFTRVVYATPAYISTLATSTPISANVPVDSRSRSSTRTRCTRVCANAAAICAARCRATTLPSTRCGRRPLRQPPRAACPSPA